jgi:hypothetical protein
VVSLTSRPLYPYETAHGTYWSRGFGEDKNHFPLPEIEPHHWAVRLEALSLYRLSCRCFSAAFSTMSQPLPHPAAARCPLRSVTDILVVLQPALRLPVPCNWVGTRVFLRDWSSPSASFECRGYECVELLCVSFIAALSTAVVARCRGGCKLSVRWNCPRALCGNKRKTLCVYQFPLSSCGVLKTQG